MINEAGYKRLYVVVNEMMAEMGANGEISAQDECVDNVMAALHEIDEGVFSP